MDNIATEIPQRIAKYDVERIIGCGAKGVVYKASDRHIKRPVAIKVLHPHLTKKGNSDTLEASFLREAKATARCSHPNIVTLFEFGKEQFPFLVMEYIDGQELKMLLLNGRISPITATKICSELLQALAHAHSKGIIHRDIKPSNILINTQGKVKISDFGLAHMKSLEDCSQKAAGTPNYMAPEALTEQMIDNRTDLFSVGVILFEMLTFQRPARDLSLEANLSRLNSLPHIPSRLTEDIKPILRKALQTDPKLRFSSAQQFLDDIKHLTQTSTNKRWSNLVSESTKPISDISAALEPILSTFVGPIATSLIKRYSRLNTSIDQIIQQLTKHIPTLEERIQFQHLSKRFTLKPIAQPQNRKK